MLDLAGTMLYMLGTMLPMAATTLYFGCTTLDAAGTTRGKNIPLTSFLDPKIAISACHGGAAIGGKPDCPKDINDVCHLSRVELVSTFSDIISQELPGGFSVR